MSDSAFYSTVLFTCVLHETLFAVSFGIVEMKIDDGF